MPFRMLTERAQKCEKRDKATRDSHLNPHPEQACNGSRPVEEIPACGEAETEPQPGPTCGIQTLRGCGVRGLSGSRAIERR